MLLALVKASLVLGIVQLLVLRPMSAAMAINMREQVRELLARGYTEEQILAYFELSYGEFVLLRPKSKMLWMLPVIALVLGAVVVFVKFRKLEREQPPTANRQPPTEEDPYLARVRDIVGGGKS